MSDVYTPYPQFDKRRIEFLHKADVLRAHRPAGWSLTDFTAEVETLDDIQRKIDKEASDILGWLDSDTVSVSQLAYGDGGTIDPRTAEQIRFDMWEAETRTTRESDYPR